MAILQGMLERFRAANGTGVDWPPREVKEAWEQIEYYRARYRNDAGLLLPFNEQYSGASYDKRTTFTPVPVAREICRYSAALLFSSPADITHETYQDDLDELMEVNALEPFWQESAETVAAEGRGAIRIIRDDAVSETEPLLSFVNEDKILWYVRHGRFVLGGAVIIEHELKKGVVLRLIEEHEPGTIIRTCYRGDTSRLGRKVPLEEHPEGEGLDELETTGLDVPTLVRWDNIPGGHSDLFAIEVQLDRLDEAESILTDKGRKSIPIVFAHRALADERGNVERSGAILTGGDDSDLGVLGEGPNNLPITLIQPDLQSAETIAWIEHTREMALTLAGFSLASWGLGEGGTADSGTALRLRQSRTLLTRQAKERMAREAMVNAIATALAWKKGAKEIQDFRPKIEFGDGMPRDEIQLSTVIQTLVAAEVLSAEEAIKMFNPSWTDEEIKEELKRLEKKNAPDPNVPEPGGLNRVTNLINQRLGNQPPNGQQPPPEA